jgi:hypothetical protein
MVEHHSTGLMPDASAAGLAARTFDSLRIVLDNKIYVDNSSGNFLIMVRHHPTIKCLIRRSARASTGAPENRSQQKTILIGNTYLADLEKRATASLLRGGRYLADGWELQSKPLNGRRSAT